jgi:hypothetical protein
MKSIQSLFHSPLGIAAVLIPWFALAAAASPTANIITSLPPVGEGDAFIPGTRAVADLEQDYAEEEFLYRGVASLFNYANDPPLSPTDLVEIERFVPYKTRIIVRRPVDAADFNGTVVIEWWNSTAGFDTAPVWDISAEYFARNGVVYIGVTNSTTSLAFLTGGCSLFGFLPPTCGTRYSTLSLPENGLAYEMVSQLANILRTNSVANPLPTDFLVERIYHAGQSQQGGSIITYASGFHFDVNDGYFVQQAASARSINSGPRCGADGSPPFPDCTPRLQSPDNLVSTDLPVPVVHAITETDIEVLFGTVGRQDDTPTFRYYEIAGGSHLTVHKDVEVLPAGLVGPDAITLEDLCQNPINSTGDGPIFVSYIFNGLWNNLEKQVKYGKTPPHGRQMDVVDGVVQRDEFGNGRGGIELPATSVPTATYTPGNVADPNLPPFLQGIGNLACRLASSVDPFAPQVLDELYPNHGSYVVKVAWRALILRFQGFLLTTDRRQIVHDAVHSGIGFHCGLGFELVFILPPLMLLHKRRRTRSA